MTRIHASLLAAASAIALASCASPSPQIAQEETKTESVGLRVPVEGRKPADELTGLEKNGVVVTGQLMADGRAEAKRVDRPREAQAGQGYAYLAPPPPPSAMPSQPYAQTAIQPRPGDIDRERYQDVEINPVKLVSEDPVSTFSIDVDTASYSNVRRMLNAGALPPKDAVRIEELINYFDYDYALPKSKDTPFETTVTVTPSPWSKGRQLMHIGVQGYDIHRDSRPPLNLTLLIDVSGSMAPQDRLPLAIKSLKLLIDELTAQDKVSIAVYAGAAGMVLEPTSGADKGKILAALDRLSAGGSTAGGEGLRLAYNLAKQNFDKKSVNRVMLLSDGDFNVGINDPEQLEDFVSRERESGVYLSILGFGGGNYNDLLMQKLAQSGNGVAAYIDNLNEGRKVLSDDLSGSMFSIANDVKIQVEFNPAKVAEYRLIGYETRLLNREDFNNDKVDAGEIGAGTSVTAIYEFTPVGSDARLIDASRYKPQPVSATNSGEYAFLKLRYKSPGADKSKLVDRPITEKDAVSDIAKAPEATRFATSVAAYGEMLRGDPYLDKAFTWDSVIDMANGAKGKDEFGYRAEFIQLARLAKTAASQQPLKPIGGGVGGQ